MRFSLIVCFFMFGVVESSGQFVRFTITLPPSFELNERGDLPIIMEPISQETGGFSKYKNGIRWIEIRTTENVELIIDTKSNRSKSPLMNTYFLNDGTLNFTNAQTIGLGQFSVKMLNQDVLISQLPDAPKYISAWLGIPTNKSGIVTIIYH